MEFSFKKLNRHQKLYLTVGSVLAILIYMFDKSNFNVAVGTFLLTVILVYWLKGTVVSFIADLIIVSVMFYIDVAFGFHIWVIEQIRYLRESFPTEVSMYFGLLLFGMLIGLIVIGARWQDATVKKKIGVFK